MPNILAKRFVVVNGKLKRTDAFETGLVLAEDPEGFERARAAGLKMVRKSLYFYVPTVVAISVLTLLYNDLIFTLLLAVLWAAFIPQEFFAMRAWNTMEHGKRVCERGVETYLVVSWRAVRYFVPYNEIKEWKRKDKAVHVKSSSRFLAWVITTEDVGEEGLDLLCSILDGSYRAEVRPPDLVLYPS